MMNLIESISRSFFSSIEKHFKLTPQQTKTVSFTLNIDETKQAFGDLSSNAGLVLAKVVEQPPTDIARTIKKIFVHESIKSIDVAGPGFINFTLTRKALQTIAHELFEQGTSFFKLATDTKKKNYSIEFISANPTGPLHIGHGRGGIIGDVLGNILLFLGHAVTKEFYINDAGSQIQKLGRSFKIRCQQASGQTVAMPEDGYQGAYLQELAVACLKEHGPALLEKPDSFFATYAKEHLLAQQQETLKKYRIIFDVWFSEKTLHDSEAITTELDKLSKNGHTYTKDGALWFKSTQFGDDKDRVLKKASGELTYVAADVAYLSDKITRGFDQLIMILGQDHHSYVSRLKGLVSAMGYDPSRLDVILYQLVSLNEGGQQLRMSKRAGRMVTLKDIIDTVGADVARFFYLNRKADAHLDFNLGLALKKSEENPVYYIQYAYVRIKSIVQKAQEESQLTNIKSDDLAHIDRNEATLLKKIVSLKGLLDTIAGTYQTHLLTYYSIELAQSFHKYYAYHRVIDSRNINQSRGRLAVLQILQNTFELLLILLGLSKPTSM